MRILNLGSRSKARLISLPRASPRWGYSFERGLAKTGIVARIEGRLGHRTIGFRADMDALPISEKTELPYASTRPGVMHACGHDGHIAMLLGAARILSENANFSGAIVLIFQPAEETGGGARVMIEEGLFDRFPVDEIYGLHNWPGLPQQQFAVHTGPVMAAADSFDIELRGVGCHAGHAKPRAGTYRRRCADHRQSSTCDKPTYSTYRECRAKHHPISCWRYLQRHTWRGAHGGNDAQRK